MSWAGFKETMNLIKFQMPQGYLGSPCHEGYMAFW